MIKKELLPACLPEVLGGNFDTCPACGGEIPGDGDQETINDGKVIVYDHVCAACDTYFAHVYAFVGVSVLNGDDDDESPDEWTEYPVDDDPRRPTPARRSVIKKGENDALHG